MQSQNGRAIGLPPISFQEKIESVMFDIYTLTDQEAKDEFQQDTLINQNFGYLIKLNQTDIHECADIGTVGGLENIRIAELLKIITERLNKGKITENECLLIDNLKKNRQITSEQLDDIIALIKEKLCTPNSPLNQHEIRANICLNFLALFINKPERCHTLIDILTLRMSYVTFDITNNDLFLMNVLLEQDYISYENINNMIASIIRTKNKDFLINKLQQLFSCLKQSKNPSSQRIEALLSHFIEQLYKSSKEHYADALLEEEINTYETCRTQNKIEQINLIVLNALSSYNILPQRLLQPIIALMNDRLQHGHISSSERRLLLHFIDREHIKALPRRFVTLIINTINNDLCLLLSNLIRFVSDTHAKIFPHKWTNSIIDTIHKYLGERYMEYDFQLLLHFVRGKFINVESATAFHKLLTQEIFKHLSTKKPDNLAKIVKKLSDALEKFLNQQKLAHPVEEKPGTPTKTILQTLQEMNAVIQKGPQPLEIHAPKQEQKEQPTPSVQSFKKTTSSTQLAPMDIDDLDSEDEMMPDVSEFKQTTP